ncbi:MAG: hypothetical protein J6P16_00205 [Eubacterium sp.]|nr:hypothetical protein [Eubacterium sp.]
MREAYGDARRRAEDAVKKAKRENKDPYLPVLDEMVSQSDIKKEVPLGLLELPLSRIVGNKERGRNNAFANNFMPLLEYGSEFSLKWSSLHDSVMKEGVRDAIRVYEYMNDYYVQEGNKRVSVSMYCGSEFLVCDVIRLLPVPADTREYQVYQDYLRFYDVSGNYLIILSEPGSYRKLADLIGQDMDTKWTDDAKRDLKSAFYRFRRQYLKQFPEDGEKGTGDAFFMYLMLFPFKTLLDDTDDQISRNIRISSAEIRVRMNFAGVLTLSQVPDAAQTVSGLKKLLTGKRGYTQTKPLSVGFIYDCDIERSRWVDLHEAGRLYVEEMTDSNVVTASYIAGEGPDGVWEALERAAADKCEVIFTVAEDMLPDAKRMAIEHPELKILNCSTGQISPSVRCYHGRFYEASFLAGVLAADLLLGREDRAEKKIGYIRRISDNTNINAFAIGASLIDPECRIIAMTEDADVSTGTFAEHGISFIADIEYSTGKGVLSRPGLYELKDGKSVYIGTPFYQWGKYYVMIVQSVLSGAWDINELLKEHQAANYWFGLNTGVVDIRPVKLPYTTGKLLSMMKNSIVNGYDPFDGEIHTKDGVFKSSASDKVTADMLINMNWLNENIE